MPNIDLASLFPLVVAAALGMVTTWFWRGRTAAADAKKAAEAAAHEAHAEADRLAEVIREHRDAERDASIRDRANLQQQISVMAESMMPVKEALREIIVKGLTHKIYPEMDLLLAKLEKGELTAKEEDEFHKGIKDRIENPGESTSQAEVDMAIILLPLLRLIETERVLGIVPALSILHSSTVMETLVAMRHEQADHDKWERDRIGELGSNKTGKRKDDGAMGK
jgi:hypothetical protein